MEQQTEVSGLLDLLDKGDTVDWSSFTDTILDVMSCHVVVKGTHAYHTYVTEILCGLKHT